MNYMQYGFTSRHFERKNISDFFFFILPFFSMKDCYEIEINIFSVQNITSVNFQKVCSSTRPSSQIKGGLTCEIVAAEVGFLFVFIYRI